MDASRRAVPVTALALVALLLAPSGPLRAEPADPVLELFTSHGCSSCPRADRLLGELIETDPALVALEYHVDYWNSLVHGSAGSFADPYSATEWSLRQRAYDGIELGGRMGVYTPQAIVDGHYAAVGSDAARIARALGDSAARRDGGPRIALERRGDEIAVSVAGVTAGEREGRTRGHLPAPMPDTGEVALVRFLHRTVTDVTGGENKGIELVNHRVVTAVEPLGAVAADGSLTATVAAPSDPAEGCAVLVRHGDEVARLVGRVCPDPA